MEAYHNRKTTKTLDYSIGSAIGWLQRSGQALEINVRWGPEFEGAPTHYILKLAVRSFAEVGTAGPSAAAGFAHCSRQTKNEKVEKQQATRGHRVITRAAHEPRTRTADYNSTQCLRVMDG